MRFKPGQRVVHPETGRSGDVRVHHADGEVSLVFDGGFAAVVREDTLRDAWYWAWSRYPNVFKTGPMSRVFDPATAEEVEACYRWLTQQVEETKMDPNKPEPSPRGRGREITPLVIKDLELRSKLGKEKYGETLRAFNGRNALVDAYQEVLDLAQYIRQCLEEHDGSEDPATNYMTRVYDAKFDAEPDVPQTAREFLARQENRENRRLIEQSLIAGGHTTREALDAQRVDVLKSLAERVECHVFESIAQEAHRLVLGDRGEAYGHPIFDMTRSADMLTALLRNKLRPGARLEAEDMGQAMICVKQSRHRNKPKRDNLTDTAGYALTLQMIAEWRAANPGVDPRDVFPDS